MGPLEFETIDDTQFDLVCMRAGCGKPLSLDHAYFCSQECLDAYQEPDYDALTPAQQAALDRELDIRDARMDRLREEDPTRYIRPIGPVVGQVVQSAKRHLRLV